MKDNPSQIEEETVYFEIIAVLHLIVNMWHSIMGDNLYIKVSVKQFVYKTSDLIFQNIIDCTIHVILLKSPKI